MALVDHRRCVVDVNGPYLTLAGRPRAAIVGHPVWANVVGGVRLTPAQWRAALAAGRAEGEAQLERPDGSAVGVQWAATVAETSGRMVVLVVVLNSSRWGSRFRRQDPPRVPDRGLSPRQAQIVGHVARGATAQEIAAELHISHHTVRSHIRNAMDTLGARSLAHLVAKALGEGHVLG
jgi:DNA-binding CsgD family transcriptional regulator